MKKLLFLVPLLCLMFFSAVSATGTSSYFSGLTSLDGVYDVPAGGEYDGYRKLLGHKLEKYYDIYFTYQMNGNNLFYHIVTVPLKTVDPNEVITLTLPDGDERSATRENWYKTFRLSWHSSVFANYIQSHYYDMYVEWALYDSGIQAEHLAEDYINKMYGPKTEFKSQLQPDSKVY